MIRDVEWKETESQRERHITMEKYAMNLKDGKEEYTVGLEGGKERGNYVIIISNFFLIGLLPLSMGSAPGCQESVSQVALWIEAHGNLWTKLWLGETSDRKKQ